MLSDNPEEKKNFKIPKLQPDVFKELWNIFMKTLKDQEETKTRKASL